MPSASRASADGSSKSDAGGRDHSRMPKDQLFYGRETDSLKYKDWKKWAKAHLAGLPQTVALEAYGPRLFTLCSGGRPGMR